MTVVTSTATDQALALDRGRQQIEAQRPEAPPGNHAATERARSLPLSLDVRYWQDDDGTWSSFCELLGVSAVSDTEEGVVPAMIDVIEEYWLILNERYRSADESLVRLLDLRFAPIRFAKDQ